MLTHLQEKVKELEPLRVSKRKSLIRMNHLLVLFFQQQLVLLSEQCDKKLMQYRKEEREEISILKEEKRRLQQAIRHLTNQNQNLEANIQRVNRNENKKNHLIIHSF
jgi:uncharacterized protein YlxW (UPF0749 family)